MYIVSILLIIILIYLCKKLNRLEDKIDKITEKSVLNAISIKHIQEKKQSINEVTESKLRDVEEADPLITTLQVPPSYVCKSVDSLPEKRLVLDETYSVANSLQEENKFKLLDSEAEIVVDSVANLVIDSDKNPLNSIESPLKSIEKQSERKSLNYEKIIGANIFSKIGILVLVLGIGYFIKYAIDNEWVNETMRSVLSYLLGVSLLVVAQKLRKKYRAFSSLLAGGTFAIFYLTTALSYHYYDLFSKDAAFAIVIGTTISMIVLSMLYDRKELSIISVIGGFIAPFIFGDKSGSIVVLLSYITLLNVAMLFISMRKRWSELSLLCFVFTYSIVIPLFSEHSSIMIIVFTTLFYLIFLISILRLQTLHLSRIIKLLYGVSFGLNNIIYFGIVGYVISDFNLSLRIHGLIPIFIAIVNVTALYITKKHTTKSSFDSIKLLMLGVIIISLTMAVPAQLDGELTNIIWALEILALLFLYIKTRIRLYNIAAFGIYILTVGRLLINIINEEVTLGFIISIAIIGGAFFIAANALRRYKDIFNIKPVKYNLFNPIFIFSGVITYVIMIVLARELVDNDQFILVIGVVYLASLIHILPYRFSIKSHTNAYLVAAMGFFIMNLIYIYNLDLYVYLIQFVCVTASLVKIAMPFIKNGDYKIKKNKNKVIAFNIIIYLTCFLMTILWLNTQAMNMSWLISIISVIIAFVQILVGMKVHFKLLRIIGMCCFGVILVKLVLIDLWSLSSSGKITTLILLGVILLIISFIYQKIQNVLFRDECSNENETTYEK